MLATDPSPSPTENSDRTLEQILNEHEVGENCRTSVRQEQVRKKCGGILLP